jgi:hypothetical protein
MLNVLGEPGYSGAVKYVGLEEISAIPGVKSSVKKYVNT